ncbi:DNA cytosine methyltransferase [Planctomycetaceae bacterium]|nr:DNA cytosine methyltransferase [Planctomycetaceae bacterium]
MKPKVASFFSGIGGFDLGLERAGMKVVFQCEVNPFAQKVLRKHWPKVPLVSDINDLEAFDIPDSSVWCAGFPCQDVSLANQGKRKGLKGARSGLFFKYASLIEQRKPQWVILENVPGLLNSHEGKDFKIVLKTLDELGYGVSWRVFDAKYFGTPQRRRRVFIVGSHGNRNSFDVLFEPDGVEVAYRSGLGKKEITASRNGDSLSTSDIYSIQHAGIGRKPSAGPQAKGYRNDGETYTLDSRGSSDAICSTNAPFRVRDASGVSKRLDSSRYRALGNAVAVPIMEWIGSRMLKIMD